MVVLVLGLEVPMCSWRAEMGGTEWRREREGGHGSYGSCRANHEAKKKARNSICSIA